MKNKSKCCGAGIKMIAGDMAHCLCCNIWNDDIQKNENLTLTEALEDKDIVTILNSRNKRFLNLLLPLTVTTEEVTSDRYEVFTRKSTKNLDNVKIGDALTAREAQEYIENGGIVISCTIKAELYHYRWKDDHHEYYNTVEKDWKKSSTDFFDPRFIGALIAAEYPSVSKVKDVVIGDKLNAKEAQEYIENGGFVSGRQNNTLYFFKWDHSNSLGYCLRYWIEADKRWAAHQDDNLAEWGGFFTVSADPAKAETKIVDIGDNLTAEDAQSYIENGGFVADWGVIYAWKSNFLKRWENPNWVHSIHDTLQETFTKIFTAVENPEKKVENPEKKEEIKIGDPLNHEQAQKYLEAGGFVEDWGVIYKWENNKLKYFQHDQEIWKDSKYTNITYCKYEFPNKITAVVNPQCSMFSGADKLHLGTGGVKTLKTFLPYPENKPNFTGKVLVKDDRGIPFLLFYFKTEDRFEVINSTLEINKSTIKSFKEI